MNIAKLSRSNLEEMAQLYVEVYQTPESKTTNERARRVFDYCLMNAAQYCFQAVDDAGKCVGAIISRFEAVSDEKDLYVESIQVKPEYRGQGTGSALLKEVIMTAKKNGIKNICFVVDNQKPEQGKWYEKFGFKQTKWVYFEAETEKLTG